MGTQNLQEPFIVPELTGSFTGLFDLFELFELFIFGLFLHFHRCGVDNQEKVIKKRHCFFVDFVTFCRHKCRYFLSTYKRCSPESSTKSATLFSHYERQQKRGVIAQNSHSHNTVLSKYIFLRSFYLSFHLYCKLITVVIVGIQQKSHLKCSNFKPYHYTLPTIFSWVLLKRNFSLIIKWHFFQRYFDEKFDE